jgi:phosphoglycerate dehydrogenase-like enzyme
MRVVATTCTWGRSAIATWSTGPRLDELYARADFITIHPPNTPNTEGWLDAEAFSKMRDGVRR